MRERVVVEKERGMKRFNPLKGTDISSSLQDILYKAASVSGQAALDVLNATPLNSFLPTSINGNDSSDDEGNLEDEVFIAYAERGIAVFIVTAIRQTSRREKTVHLDLFQGEVRVYAGKSVRCYNCSNIHNVQRRTDTTISLENRSPTSIVPKVWQFADIEVANQFQLYLEYLIEFGTTIRTTFSKLISRGSNTVTLEILRAAMHGADLEFTEIELQNIFEFSNQKKFDFSEYFHCLLGTPVYSMRDCLQLVLLNTRRRHLEKGPNIQNKNLVVDESKLALSTENHVSGVLHNPNDEFVNEDQGLKLLPGENSIRTVPFVRWLFGNEKCLSSDSYFGTMTMTNYRIFLSRKIYTSINTNKSSHSRYPQVSFFNSISIPYNSVFKISSFSQPNNKLSLNIISKDGKSIKFFFVDYRFKASQTEELLVFLTSRCFGGDIRHIFAYKYCPIFKNDGWTFADIRMDYKRMGVLGDSEWQIFDNSDWNLVETYPQHFAIPSNVTTDVLRDAAAYRSKERLPAMTYRNQKTQTCLCRSSQPLAGIMQKSCVADVYLLNLYRTSGVFNTLREMDNPATFYIVDARSRIAANANMAAGKGTEDISLYANTDMIFCDIDNIHAVRNSLVAFAELIYPNNPTDSEANYFAKLDSSGWLYHVSKILSASRLIAEKMYLECSSVLVHCSDGWDRTAQLTSTAQILMDPYYRSLDGLFVVVEKEWCAFGHKFHHRFGHLEGPSVKTDERSPVFIQWLDVLHNLLEQFPTIFEYNMNTLVFLADHVHSGLFGNFLGNSDKHRNSHLSVLSKSRSIWGYILENKEKFTNPRYSPTDSPIWPQVSLSEVAIWRQYFCRWDPALHPNSFMNEVWCHEI